MNEWNIQSRSHACEGCEREFEDRQKYHTLLFSEKKGYRRMDVCDPCWKEQFSEGATERKGFVSYWQGAYRTPPPPEPEPIQKENAESLFRKLIERNDPENADVCYILAVMLERKRIIKVQAQLREEGRRIFVYEHPKSGDCFTVADPDLQLDRLEKVQRHVAELLEKGLGEADGEQPAFGGEPEPVAGEPAEDSKKNGISEAGVSGDGSGAGGSVSGSEEPAPAAEAATGDAEAEVFDRDAAEPASAGQPDEEPEPATAR